ncbi:MAG: hypothetical protein JJ858_09350 [Rhizobiaceae bacterium]|nr:hypothetical protein [Rhizobiaceae bacterium]
MNNFRIRNFITLVIAFALFGCVSTSLEDAAPTEPTSLTVNQQVQSLDDGVVVPSQQSNINAAQISTTDAQSSNVAQSPVSDGNLIPPKPSGEEFPTFAEDRRGEINQMTPEEKAAIEAQMTELLIQRETDPRIKARYQARLRYLRNLAKSHASDTSAKIAQ